MFEVQVYLDDLDPNAVRVELYADGINGGAPVRQEMKRVRQLAGASGGYVYSAAVPAARPASGLYGARDTALRRRCDPTGRRSNPVAAMIDNEEKKYDLQSPACFWISAASCSPTGGIIMPANGRRTTFKLELDRDGGTASPDLRHLRGGEAHRWKNIWTGWSSTKSDRSPGLSFGASCSRNRNLIPR